jgi:hypothetical protein
MTAGFEAGSCLNQCVVHRNLFDIQRASGKTQPAVVPGFAAADDMLHRHSHVVEIDVDGITAIFQMCPYCDAGEIAANIGLRQTVCEEEFAGCHMRQQRRLLLF